MSINNTKRATIRLKTPNPLFEKWISEWIDEARDSGNISKSISLSNALNSLKKFPLVLKTGKECMILEHFETNLCVQLDRKLVSHKKLLEREENTESSSLNEAVASGPSKLPKHDKQKPRDTAKENSQSKKSKTKEYLPSYRSAAYALLLTLYKNESTGGHEGYMTKQDLQKQAQRLTDTSLKKVQSGTFFTGWTSMSQLITKGLVVKTSKPARFSLSEEGRKTAERLANKEIASFDLPPTPESTPPDIVISEIADIIAPTNLRSKKRNEILPTVTELESEESQPIEDDEEIVLSPGTFDTILLVDNAETSGSNCPDDETIVELKATGVKFEVRHLKVGDFMWICRSMETDVELVLPFIVERKRMDDLSRSIIDGRFHEQKFRLKKCGVYNVIYLIEETGGKKFGLPLASLHQAINNTMISDEFTIKMTSNHVESMLYLANITTMLTNMFRNKVLFSCKKSEWCQDIMDETAFLLTFKTFSNGLGKSRNFKTKEMFVKQLVQLHGMSADKAWAIVDDYPTPAALISAFKNSSVQLLSNIQYGVLKRKIGPTISSQLYNFYTEINLK